MKVMMIIKKIIKKMRKKNKGISEKKGELDEDYIEQRMITIENK